MADPALASSTAVFAESLVEVRTMLDRRVAQALVELADTLVAGFDVIDLLHTLTERCVDLLAVDAAGLLLAQARGALSPVAASSEQVRLLELLQLEGEDGPGLDCYRSGVSVACPDLSAEQRHWPAFTAAARERGFAAVLVLPMRLREQTLGALSLFTEAPGALPAEHAEVAQSLADVATIGMLHERSLREKSLAAEQLQGALNSRILIEQAKGVLSERLRLPMDAAFNAMRSYARGHHQNLSEVARAVLDGSLSGALVVPGGSGRAARSPGVAAQQARGSSPGAAPVRDTARIDSARER
jgi:transcriptional regulator with GAF, ATPase, and Fis domain